MLRNTWVPVLFAALALGTQACKKEESSTGRSKCTGNLCLEVYRTFYSTQPCDGAEDETCQYANVFFVLNEDKKSVLDLDADAVEMTVNGREVGVEGSKSLTSSNGLLVSLLLDQSYSITQSGSEDAVKESAKAFLDSLPDEARVSVATFASEPEVPLLVCSDGSASTYTGSYTDAKDAKVAVEYHYDAYDSMVSGAYTKIYDAVSRWATFSPSSTELKQLQRVMVVFTDGSDTASTYRTVKETLAAVELADPTLQIYAIGLGDDVDEAALKQLSSDRLFLASSKSELEEAFDEVSNALGAIYHLRVLVPSIESNAKGNFSLKHRGATITTEFVLETELIDDGTGGEGGGGETGYLCGDLPEEFDRQRLEAARKAVGVSGGGNEDIDGGTGNEDGGFDGGVAEDGGGESVVTEDFDTASLPEGWSTQGSVVANGNGMLNFVVLESSAAVWGPLPVQSAAATGLRIDFNGVQGLESASCHFAFTAPGPFESGSVVPTQGVGVRWSPGVVMLMDYATGTALDQESVSSATSADIRLFYTVEGVTAQLTLRGPSSEVVGEVTLQGIPSSAAIGFVPSFAMTCVANPIQGNVAVDQIELSVVAAQ